MDLSKDDKIDLFKKSFSTTLDFFIKEFGGILEFKEQESESQKLFVIILKNKKLLKQIEFQYVQGINIDEEPYDIFTFYVSFRGVPPKEKESFRESFFLNDYCSFKGKDSEFTLSNDIEERISQYFNIIKRVLLEYGLKDMLLMEKWISIPIDYSPNK